MATRARCWLGLVPGLLLALLAARPAAAGGPAVVANNITATEAVPFTGRVGRMTTMVRPRLLGGLQTGGGAETAQKP